MKLKTVYKYYEELLQDKVNYYYNPDINNPINIDNIFNSGESKKFISQYFTNSGKGDLVEWLKNNKLFSIDDLRANHTVSAYLFGIIIRDRLSLDMSGLPRLEKKYRDNFLYFWSYTCLFHDAAHQLEKMSIQYIENCSTVQDLLKNFKIEYNLLDYIKDKKYTDLVQNYYRYRISNEIIDHGITGALFLFNGLMIVYEKAKKFGHIEKTSYVYNQLNYSFKFVEHIMHIAITIASHNMWRASKESINDYFKFNLHDLIEDGSGSSIVKLDSKNNLLFLLGMIDTIEPIKILKYKSKDPYQVIKDVSMNINYEEYSLGFFGNKKDINIFIKSINEMKKWISIELLNVRDEEVNFKINRDNKKIVFKDLEG